MLHSFCITKPRKKLEVDKTHVKKNLKGFIELFVGALWLMFLNFETTRCQFHKKPCAWRKVIRQILLLISWLFKQKLTLPLYQQYLNLFVIKKRRKIVDLSPKSTSKQPFAKYFFLSLKKGSDYWLLKCDRRRSASFPDTAAMTSSTYSFQNKG